MSEQKEEELPPVISELEKQKLDTAIRWANNLGTEIQNVLKLIIKSKNESKKTVDLVKKIEQIEDNKIHHELINSEYEKLDFEREKAEKEAKEATKVNELAEKAYERQDVKDAHSNTDKLKEIKNILKVFTPLLKNIVMKF